MDRDDLVYLSREPLNAETALDRQVGVITPTPRHYITSAITSPYPRPRERSAWTVPCAGRCGSPATGQAFLEPPVAGLEIA